MRNTNIPILEIIAAIALIVIAFTTCRLYLPRTGVGDAATWAGALGAFLAFGGTIWVATSETRRRSQEELLKARLHASSMVLRLAHAQAVIAAVCRELDKSANVDCGRDPFLKCCNAINEIDIWDISDLVPIAPLPNNLAVRLGEASDQIRTCVRILGKTPGMDSLATGPARMAFAQSLHTNLTHTFQLIEQSIIECKLAAKALYSKG